MLMISAEHYLDQFMDYNEDIYSVHDKEGISKLTSDLVTSSEVSEDYQIDLVWHYGMIYVGDAPNGSGRSSGIIYNDTHAVIYTDEIYVGNARRIKITPPASGYTYRVAAYLEGHVFNAGKSITSFTNTESVIDVNIRPRINSIKYLRVIAKKDDLDNPDFTDSDISAIENANTGLKVKVTSNNTWFFNDRALNNPLIKSMTHQGFNPKTNGHTAANRMISLFGGYQRGFDVLLVNLKFTSDNTIILNHDDSITYNGVPYPIAGNTYDHLSEVAADAHAMYIPTIDDACYLAKMCGMELFFANAFLDDENNNDDKFDKVFKTLKKYQMHRHTHWLTFANSSIAAHVRAITAFDPHARFYYFVAKLAPDSGAQTAETWASVLDGANGAISVLNALGDDYPDAEFYLWLGTADQPVPDEVDGETPNKWDVYANALKIINLKLHNNVFTGVCNVDTPEKYVKLAPYMTTFNSDMITSGNVIEDVIDQIRVKYPELADDGRMR